MKLAARLVLIVTVIGVVLLGYQNCGSSGGGGGGSATPPGGNSVKYIFVTSNPTPSNMGGLAGADGICTTYAQAGGLTGTFKAFLSDSTQSAMTRLSNVGPWYLVGTNTIAANNLASLATTPATDILIDQNGNTLTGGTTAWTGTTMGGGVGDHCQNWSVSNSVDHAHYVIVGGVSGSWQPNSRICVGSLNLICVQQ